MSTVRVVYDEQPNFPATDQHPDAVRYQVLCTNSSGVEKTRWVDAIGGSPNRAEVEAVINPA